VKKLVFCEDDNHIAVLVEFCLEDLGFEIERFCDGGHALERLGQEPRPDIVLLDLNLPTKTGLEILAELKADPARASIPVIIISARAKDADRAQAIESGASAYLTKPFDTEELISTVETFAAEARAVATA